MVALAYIAVILLSYLAGSIPSGFLAGKMRGIDIRKEGSGNIGATNVFRILGRRAGTGVLLADAVKGWLAVAVIVELVLVTCGSSTVAAGPAPDRHGLQLAAGISAILGHNFTCWLGFRGGKGIATTGGVLIAWLPLPFLVVLGIWIAVFGASRYVSLASIAAAVGLPVATWYFDRRISMIIITGLLGALAIYRHRSNIRRLLNGTENRFGGRKRESTG